MNSVTMCDGCVAVLGGSKITVTIDTDRHRESFCRVQVAFFQKASPASQGAQNLLAGRIFDGLACQKCFCVTLDKSNRTEDEQVYEIGGVYNAKNDKRNGG